MRTAKYSNKNLLKLIKRCSASYVLRELWIKATMKNHYIPTRMVKVNAGEGVEQQELSLVVGMQDGSATLEDSLTVLTKQHILTILFNYWMA